MRAALVILCLIAVIGAVLLFLRKSGNAPHPVIPVTAPTLNSNAPPQSPPSVVTISSTNDSGWSIRPASLDEQTWRKYLSYRQVVLSEDQPIEFYARVLDQNNQPVEGAKLTVSVERLNEAVFVPTNYLHWDPALAFQKLFFDLYSDSNGWIKFTGTNGIMLDMTGLNKEGYVSTYPNGNFGGVHYESSGERTGSGDILMTNAWNPQKGYILHLEKIEETNSASPAK